MDKITPLQFEMEAGHDAVEDACAEDPQYRRYRAVLRRIAYHPTAGPWPFLGPLSHRLADWLDDQRQGTQEALEHRAELEATDDYHRATLS